MTTIASTLESVKQRIVRAAEAAGRDGRSIRLLAVSKLQPAEAIRAAYAAGQEAFGESYVQEALAKIEALRDLPLEWHFIGPLQSNKTAAVAQHFAWVHSVDRLKIARRLSEARPKAMPPLNVCLQVNISGEVSKGGARPDDVADLADEVAMLPRLNLRGLMAIPRASDDPAEQRRQFAALRRLYAALQSRHGTFDTLSMGMSHDLEAAIAEGATLIRVGEAIFGVRPGKAAG
ncbi:MAG: YggS family pyridoxal phosphate-dependent enzyme [Sulfuricellaceae bacterium]|nr:YggS family pyridoxal phosphate-dependent enzyme [Sulfuricellaceae bacterium]